VLSGKVVGIYSGSRSPRSRVSRNGSVIMYMGHLLVDHRRMVGWMRWQWLRRWLRYPTMGWMLGVLHFSGTMDGLSAMYAFFLNNKVVRRKRSINVVQIAQKHSNI